MCLHVKSSYLPDFGGKDTDWQFWDAENISSAPKYNLMTHDNTSCRGGEHYLTDRGLSERLKISRRTLQDYRNNGILPYRQLGGKILYRESDIERVLQKQYKRIKLKFAYKFFHERSLFSRFTAKLLFYTPSGIKCFINDVIIPERV